MRTWNLMVSMVPPCCDINLTIQINKHLRERGYKYLIFKGITIK
jgi:hypothetical protein